MFFRKKSVSNGQVCLILWTKGYYKSCWVYKRQKNKNPTKTYEDKVLKNETSEKDSALPLWKRNSSTFEEISRSSMEESSGEDSSWMGSIEFLDSIESVGEASFIGGGTMVINGYGIRAKGYTGNHGV